MTDQKLAKPAPPGVEQRTTHQTAKEAFEKRVAEGDDATGMFVKTVADTSDESLIRGRAYRE